MGRTQDVMLNIVSGLSANMAAGPLAASIMGGLAGTAVTMNDLRQAAAYGVLLLGTTFIQVCQGRKASSQEAAKLSRIERAVGRLATHQDEAQQELADLALEQQWVREALERTEGVTAASFKTAWTGQVESALRDVGVGVAEINGTLRDMAVLEFDTNARVRDLQTAVDRTEGKVDKVLSETQQFNIAISQLAESLAHSTRQNQGLLSENESLKAELVAVTERYIKAEQSCGRSWRAVIEELRHDPKKLGIFLDSETSRDKDEFIEKHRERASVWYVLGEIEKAMASLKTILALNDRDLDAINYLGHIHVTQGRLDEAERCYLRLSELSTQESIHAASYCNLGVIESTRGNLYDAEAYHKKALALNEKLGQLEGMAIQYGNIGNIENTRGNLDAAETYHKKALAINEKLGRLEGMASDYGNLGVIERTRGNLDAAEDYQKKSLAIEEKLGRLEGMAIQYGNLGNIESTRGNLDAAEDYSKKALAINEKLGRLEGMANQFGNFAIIEGKRGNLDAAEDYSKKALAINEKLGLLEGMASDYGNLGIIERTRENLDAAEAYQKKSLAIEEKLGRLEGMASDYSNLGTIEGTRGNLTAAETYYKKALAINKKLGRLEGVAIQYANLGTIEEIRRNTSGARRFWILARDLFRKVGAKPMEQRVQALLDSMPE